MILIFPLYKWIYNRHTIDLFYFEKYNFINCILMNKYILEFFYLLHKVHISKS